MAGRARTVAIVGSGISALILAKLLADSGILSVIYDTSPWAGFSSTRNQGWLHSGLLYAATGDLATARLCHAGANWIRHFAPSAIDPSMSSYYLFPDDQAMGNAVNQWRSLQFNPLPQIASSTSVPMIRNGPFQKVLQMHDSVIDVHQVLQQLAGEAEHAGVVHHRVGRLADISIAWTGSHWEVAYAGGAASSFDAVVLACGAYIPTILSTIVPAPSLSLSLEKCVVVVVRGSFPWSLIAIPNVPNAPQVVPWFNGGGANICFYAERKGINYITDNALPSGRALRQLPIKLGRFIDAALPGMAAMVSQWGNFNACFYMCQKLRYSQPQGTKNILQSFAPQGNAPRSLFVLYSGKFTTAPPVAADCAKQIAALVGRSPRHQIPQQTPASIAMPPYRDIANYPNQYQVLGVGGRLRFQ